jgi:hypothetical protein
MPNPVPGMPMAAGGGRRRRDSGRFALYPTRAIRRKNLGEFLLWSAVHGRDNLRFATTLEPKNPAEREIYAQWVRFAATHRLPVEFALGRRRRFADLLAEADFLVTTSIAEGFGLAFLEGWPAGLDLRGRNLPAITREFAADGIDMQSLYDHLMVPLAWLDRDRLARAFRNALECNAAAYGRHSQAREHDEVVERIMREPVIDFGRLDEGLQRGVIEGMLANRRDPAELNPGRLGLNDIGGPRVAANAVAVAGHYNLDQYGERLLALYDALMQAGDATDDTRVSSRALIEQFQAPERLSLLRSAPAQ